VCFFIVQQQQCLCAVLLLFEAEAWVPGHSRIQALFDLQLQSGAAGDVNRPAQGILGTAGQCTNI
jgi:hypothetical protein